MLRCGSGEGDHYNPSPGPSPKLWGGVTRHRNWLFYMTYLVLLRAQSGCDMLGVFGLSRVERLGLGNESAGRVSKKSAQS